MYSVVFYLLKKKFKTTKKPLPVRVKCAGAVVIKPEEAVQLPTWSVSVAGLAILNENALISNENDEISTQIVSAGTVSFPLIIAN